MTWREYVLACKDLQRFRECNQLSDIELARAMYELNRQFDEHGGRDIMTGQVAHLVRR